MKLILKNAKIIDRDWNGKKRRFDIAVKNGKIESIAPKLDLKGYQIVSSPNLHVSIGFFDIGTQIGEPGLEHRETLESIAEAAASGGYTAIAPFPNTDPPIQSKSDVLFIRNETNSYPVRFYPIGAISKSCKGEDITEIMDMKNSGAVAFSDGKKNIRDAGLMARALQYSKACQGIIINHPEEESLSYHGQIHEGEVSVSLGLEGKPEMAEIIGITRDLQLNDYSDGRYCAYNISTAEAAKIIKKEKEDSDQNISATVAYLNLIFTEQDIKDFNVNLKVNPPLRTEKDRKALVKKLQDNTIDAITSGHSPIETELKKMSFAFASFGAIGIETVFSALNTFGGEKLQLELLIDKISRGPRHLLNIEIPEIKEGSVADLCIFDPDIKWTYHETSIKSKSKNSPFIDQDFTGKVIGIIGNGKYIPNNAR